MTRPGPRARLLALFAALAVGVCGAIAGGLWLGQHHGDAALTGGIAAGFGAVGLIVWVWFLLDRHAARPLGALSGALRTAAHGGGGLPEAPHLGDLAPATAAVTAALTEARSALAQAVEGQTARIGAEKARLEALLSDVAEGVILCSGAHRVVFYNGAAAEALGVPPGLDRPVFDVMHPGALRHAHERLTQAGDSEAVSDILCTTVNGARMMAARMRLLPGEGGAGYVLTFRDVTADQAAGTARAARWSAAVEGLRRPAANLGALLGVLPDGEVPPPRLITAVRDEASALVSAVTALAAAEEAAAAEVLLAATHASDLVEAIAAQLSVAALAASVEADPILLRCNGFETAATVAHLARGVSRGGVGSFRITLRGSGVEAILRVAWTGAPATVAEVESWLAEPLDAALPGLTGQKVLTAHATTLWPEAGEGEQALCLPLVVRRQEGARPAPLARTVVYDFDLLSQTRGAAVADTPLSALTCVVFDTETTGLLPDKGDEIVQIAGLRLVNGRRVAGEVFDRLVNPGRPIPAASAAVHGITDAMVAGAPGIAEVGRAFHRFAAGAVLVAHNAPFDMAFLRRHAAAIGAPFDHPILDTVLLSAVVYGPSETHSLDALTHRLGIVIPEEARHTALGDATATAEAFLRLVPMLAARGLETFGQVLAEVRRHGRLLKDLN